MATQVKIDFVSDVSCPWCVIGLKSLQTALKSLKGEVAADLHFLPFEINPQMSGALTRIDCCIGPTPRASRKR